MAIRASCGKISEVNERMYETKDLHSTRTRQQETEFVVSNAPVPAQRALAPRGPVALALGSSAMLMLIWVFGVLGSAGAITGGAGPLAAIPGSAASVRQNTTANLPSAPQAAV